jgi:hypothetical protein
MKNAVNMFTLWTEYKSKNASLSQLYWNGTFICYICEDEIRQIGFKIAGETAIWGDFLYKMSLEDSGKFGPNTPTINGVPMFKYIRMHDGVNEAQTDGCLIYGPTWNPSEMTVGRDSGSILAQLRKIIGNGKPSYMAIVRNVGEGVT